MSNAEASQPEMDQEHKGESIGEGFLVGVGQEFSLGTGVDSCPLVGREPILLNMLAGSPGEAPFVSNHLQVYLEMLEGVGLIPTVVGDGAEFASSFPRFDEFIVPENIKDGEVEDLEAMLLPQMMG